MKRNHRIRRSTTQPEPASIGAPFQGVFGLLIQNMNDPAEVEIYAIKIPASGSSAETIEVWTPNKSIDVNAFEIFDNAVKTVPVSAVVSAGGEMIQVTLASNLDTKAFYVIPGHPALLSTSGQQCGGGAFQSSYA